MVEKIIYFITNIGFDPVYSVLGLILLIGGIIILVRVMISRRRIKKWKHVIKSSKYDKED